jgi:dCTP deaminase
MILSDSSIRAELEMANGGIVIDPSPQDWQIQPASVELTLAADFFSPYESEPVHHLGAYTILPGECVLGTTVERVELHPGIVGRVEGKSSWGRRFLMIHSTAGFIDPGFKGTITLELVNLSKVSQILPVGSPIAQISFQYTDRPVARPYGSEGLNSHYQGQTGVTPSAIPWY